MSNQKKTYYPPGQNIGVFSVIFILMLVPYALILWKVPIDVQGGALQLYTVFFIALTVFLSIFIFKAYTIRLQEDRVVVSQLFRAKEIFYEDISVVKLEVMVSESPPIRPLAMLSIESVYDYQNLEINIHSLSDKARHSLFQELMDRAPQANFNDLSGGLAQGNTEEYKKKVNAAFIVVSFIILTFAILRLVR